MPGQTSVTDQSLKPAYVILMLMLIVFSLMAYTLVPWVIAIVLNWPKQWSDLLRTTMPSVENSVLWDGKLCVPRMEMNFLNPGSARCSLIVVDLESKETTELRTKIPFGQVNLVADKTTLWCVINSAVIRVQNGEISQTSSGRTLQSPETAFVYQGQLAVIENSIRLGLNGNPSSVFQLLVWTGTRWQLEGELLLPGPIDGDADNSLVDEQANLSTWGGATKAYAIEAHGKTYWFCTDGNRTLYTGESVIIPENAVSALAAENIGVPIPGWEAAGSFSEFELGSDSQGPLLLQSGGRVNSPAIGAESKVLRIRDGRWTEAQALARRKTLNSHLVSDGIRALVVGLTLTQDLALEEILESGVKESKLKIDEQGSSVAKLSQTVQNVGWWSPYVVAILFAMSASWLMTVYRNSRYEFGDSAVELASITRRTLAKMADWLIVILPLIAVNWMVFGSLDQKKITEDIFETILGADGDPVELIKKGMIIFLGFLIYGLACLTGLGIMEGIWGISPGKWLCGIRVVRTTLRPCGFFRAAVRELMLIVDCAICSWLPGACCVAFTDCRQRVGDLVGDTIVIRRRKTVAVADSTDPAVI